jgi:hypothetical protein
MGQLCPVGACSFEIRASKLYYHRLSSAQRVIVVGHGPGSHLVMDLLERRCMSNFSG